jgi:hypothetical protein
MRTEARWLFAAILRSILVLLAMTAGQRVALAQAQHVRWDIINVDFTTSPPTITAGGEAFATARNPASLKIRFMGSGTFVAPASGGTSGAVTGGGTWETFSGCPDACVSTGSGTYAVTRLANWHFANFQLPGLNDLIGPNAANGNAVLRVQYSDGAEGILGISCHGPGAPPGAVEGVIATKDEVTYWDAEMENFTVFHLQ